MIYLGNTPVGAIVKQFGDGIEVKTVAVEEDFVNGKGLGDFIVENVPSDCVVWGINESVMGIEVSDLPSQTLEGFFAVISSGSISSGGFLRNNNGSWQFQLNFTTTYGIHASVGDKIILIYKEVTA